MHRRPVWYSTAQVADLLGVSSVTVYRLINSGELVAYRIGRVIRVRGEDLDAYLDAARLKPGDLSSLTS